MNLKQIFSNYLQKLIFMIKNVVKKKNKTNNKKVTVR